MTSKPKPIIRAVLSAVLLFLIIMAGWFMYHNMNMESNAVSTIAEPLHRTEPSMITIHTESQPRRIKIQGRVRAENRLEIFPEVQAKVLPGNKPFREGIAFEKGEPILILDGLEAQLKLYAARSGFQSLIASLLPDIRLDYPVQLNQYEQWLESLHPERTLQDIPDFYHPRMERFLVSRGVYDRFYQIKSAEHHLEKFTIKAPFSGILSVARAEPGQSVGPQLHVGTFVDSESYQLTAAVRQSQIRFVGIGDTMELTDNHMSGSWTAAVVRLNPSVDVRSQTVEIYLEVGGNGIREGMYLEGWLETGDPAEVAEIPKSALLRNGYVYTVVDSVVRQVPVQVVDVGHETVWVSGIEDGDRILRDAGNAMSGKIMREKMP